MELVWRADDFHGGGSRKRVSEQIDFEHSWTANQVGIDMESVLVVIFFFFVLFFFLRFTRIHFFCAEQKNRIMSVGVSVALILFMNVEVAVSLCARVVSEVAVRWGCDLARRRPLGASLLEMLFDGSSRSCEMKASTERISFRCDCCFPAESKLFA